MSRHRTRSWFLCSLSTFILVLTTLTLSGTGASAQATNPPRPANPYGVNIFLHKEVEPWKIEQTLRLVAAANIQWIKQEFPWQEIEFKKGYFYDDKWQKSSWQKYDQIVDLADKYHLTIIARIDHPPGWAQGSNAPLKDNKDLADFINAFLDHYKGRIKYLQVWNEPNLSAEWVPGKAVDPAAYAQMLKDVYPAVKAKHPEAYILSAPMAMTTEGPQLRGNMNEIDYWTGLYQAGVKGSFDIASANGYGLDQPPDAPPDPKVLNFRRVELLRNVMVQNGDAAKPIWFDEYGWNASPDTLPPAERDYWRHVTPQQQADWTVAGIEYARKHWPWAGVISIWYFRQVGDIPPDKAEYYFAMLNLDFSPQPVYNAVKADAAKYPGPSAQPAGTPVNLPSATPAPPSKPTAPPAATPTTAPAVVATYTVAPAAQSTSTPGAPTTTPTGTATSVAPSPTGTAAAEALASPTPLVEATSGTSQGGGSGWIFYLLGGILLVGGLGALGYYLMRGRT